MDPDVEVMVSALRPYTHRRSERCTRALLRRLEAGEQLDDDDLDVLALVLLTEERVRFAIPARWWGGQPETVWGRAARALLRRLEEGGLLGDDEQTWLHRQRIQAAASRRAARQLPLVRRCVPRVLRRGHRKLGGVDGPAKAVSSRRRGGEVPARWCGRPRHAAPSTGARRLAHHPHRHVRQVRGRTPRTRTGAATPAARAACGRAR